MKDLIINKIYIGKSLSNGFIYSLKKNDSIYQGFCDVNKNIIIEPKKMTYYDSFSSHHDKDICLIFKIDNMDEYEYYHIQKNNHNYNILFDIKSNDINPFKVSKINNNDAYWMFSISKPKNSYALYNVKNNEVITAFLDLIEIKNSNKIYYEKDILSYYKDKKIYHTTISGYLDKNGNYKSSILDKNSGLLYDTLYLGNNTNSYEFQNFLENIKEIYYNKYLINNKKSKILKFRKKDN